jgi:hypothetical protein
MEQEYTVVKKVKVKGKGKLQPVTGYEEPKEK